MGKRRCWRRADKGEIKLLETVVPIGAEEMGACVSTGCSTIITTSHAARGLLQLPNLPTIPSLPQPTMPQLPPNLPATLPPLRSVASLPTLPTANSPLPFLPVLPSVVPKMSHHCP
ncbi:hypothetical protein CQW23_08804 [Capsicum baccatum]|uniref:Uncharacterized protein n=1 Tax=Capsicum baccatum TaxID=33114 RepID=A0A2G2XA02_CAPBA|nr:hypothetical protein CQW23_08804 [Capsicum baccatum]